jgi:hypothetical protein
MSFNERYAKEEKKTFSPPEGVQAAARKALKWIEEGHAGSGFTGVGRGRAHQLANGEAVSLSTIKRMHSFFSRHRVDKQGKDWNKPSPGKVAWYAWGGDAGASWAAGIAKSHDGKKKEASAAEVLGLLTPAAIVAQPFIMDKINKSNDKKRKQEKPEEEDALEKEAGAAEIAQTIVNHLPLAVPAAVAGGAAITKVVDKIIKKKNAPPATGTEEAYNSTGFMSPQQVQERREASFDERYANEKTANQYIEKQGDSWVITQKSTGKVLSHHDSKEKAEASFRAMMQSKHGSVIAAKKCKCGHEEGAHMWDTKMDPEAESQMEDLGCRECGSWTRDGDFETDCKEFDADKDFRGQHSNLNSDW